MSKVNAMHGASKTAAQAQPATSNLVRLTRLFRFAQDKRRMVAASGPPACGKTFAAKQYRAQNPGVLHVELSPTAAAPGPFLATIARALGIKPWGGPWDIRRRLEDLLEDQRCDPAQLWILDEMHFPGDASLQELRTIVEVARLGCVLLGNPTVSARFKGDRNAAFQQVTSRCFPRIELERPTILDVAPIAERFGVHQKADVDYLVRLARRVEGLRGVAAVLELAGDLAGDNKCPGEGELKAAASMLLGERP